MFFVKTELTRLFKLARLNENNLLDGPCMKKNIINVRMVFLLTGLLSLPVNASTLSASEPANGKVTISWTCTGVYCQLRRSINQGAYTTLAETNVSSSSRVENFNRDNHYLYHLRTYNASGPTGPVVTENDYKIVEHVNQAPTVSSVGNLDILMNGTTGRVYFTVGDDDGAAGLSVSVDIHSGGAALVPQSAIELGGSATSRWFRISPTKNMVGGTGFNIRVSDGDKTASEYVHLDVAETIPTISNISNKTIIKNESISNIGFVVGDQAVPASDLTITKRSSNTSLVPNGNLTLGGSGANRTLSVQPTADRTGTSTITLIVSNGVASSQEAFTVTVEEPPNEAPELGSIPDITMNENEVHTKYFAVTDDTTDSSSVQFNVTSSNTTLLPVNRMSIVEASSNNFRLRVEPVVRRYGVANVTIIAVDGDGAESDGEVVKVTVVDIPPPSTPSYLTYPNAVTTEANIDFEWGPVSGGATYELQKSLNGDSFVSVYSGSETATSSSHPEGTYIFRVRACNNVHCSGFRAGAEMVVEPPEEPLYRSVIFIHTDALGSPSAETNEEGDIND